MDRIVLSLNEKSWRRLFGDWDVRCKTRTPSPHRPGIRDRPPRRSPGGSSSCPRRRAPDKADPSSAYSPPPPDARRPKIQAPQCASDRPSTPPRASRTRPIARCASCNAASGLGIRPRSRHAVLQDQARHAFCGQPIADLRPLQVDRQDAVPSARKDHDRRSVSFPLRRIKRQRGLRDVSQPHERPAPDLLARRRGGVRFRSGRRLWTRSAMWPQRDHRMLRPRRPPALRPRRSTQ